MTSLIANVVFLAALAAAIPSTPGRAEDLLDTAELWSCSGYCFMGGDTPTNPWIPVSATGASEDEARDNIDCGQFVEVNITCRKVQYQRNFQ